MTQQEAYSKRCPFKFNNPNIHPEDRSCIGNDCMAWFRFNADGPADGKCGMMLNGSLIFTDASR